MDDWNEAQCDADVLTQVLAASQQEYLDSLKTAKDSSKSRRSSSDSNQDPSNVNTPPVSNTNNSSSKSAS